MCDIITVFELMFQRKGGVRDAKTDKWWRAGPQSVCKLPNRPQLARKENHFSNSASGRRQKIDLPLRFGNRIIGTTWQRIRARQFGGPKA